MDDNEIQYLKDILNAPLSIEKFIDKYLEKFSLSQNLETQYKGKKFLNQLIKDTANKDLKDILKSYFKDFQLVKAKNSVTSNISSDIKNDLKSKFCAGVILAFIENHKGREEIYDLLLTSKFDGIFEDVRLLITKTMHFNKSPSDLFELLDLKGLNFTKNQLFSREIRRLCRFANYPFKGDLYLEVEKALNYINSYK